MEIIFYIGRPQPEDGNVFRRGTLRGKKINLKIPLRETAKLTKFAACVSFFKTKMKEILYIKALNCFNLTL